MNEPVDECKSEKSLVNFLGALAPWGIVWHATELAKSCGVEGTSYFSHVVLSKIFYWLRWFCLVLFLKNINSMRYIFFPVTIRNSSFNLRNVVAPKRSNSVTALDSPSADRCGQLKLESSALLCPLESASVVPSTAVTQGLGFPRRARGVAAIQLTVQMKFGQSSRLFLLWRVPRAFHYTSL